FGLRIRIDQNFSDWIALYGEKNGRTKFRVGDKTVSHGHADRHPGSLLISTPYVVVRKMTTPFEYEKLAVYFLMSMREISAIDNDQSPNPPPAPAEPINIERSTAFVIAANEVLDIAEPIAVSVRKRQIVNRQIHNSIRKHIFRFGMKPAIKSLDDFIII